MGSLGLSHFWDILVRIHILFLFPASALAPRMNRILLSTVSALLLASAAPIPSFAAEETLPPLAADDAPVVELAASQAAVPEAIIAAPLSDTQKEFAALLWKSSYQGVPVAYPAGLRDFYKTHDYKPLWIDGKKIARKNVKSTLQTLESSWMDGLVPGNYNVKLLRQMAEADLDAAQLNDFEILMSDAVARYGHDITGMRVSAKALGEDTKSWSKGIDAVQVLTFVASGDDAGKSLESLAPSGRLYNAMKEDLVKLLKDMAEHPDADPKPLAFGKTLRPGDRSPVIADVRTRLGLSARSADINTVYDEALAKDVAKFQRASGLKADSILGKRTFAALNQGRKDKLVKLLANMERQRWMEARLPSRYIVVNIPAMMLWAIEDGKVKLEMPVVVGREKRATNSFITNITGIRFNPSWNVPDTIKTEDYLPALQKDSQALKKKGIELIHYTSDGYETIVPESIDWSTMTPQSIKAIGMVQNPGDDNALGRIRVLMPNQYNIYLHDTNSPELFKKDFRALSSGCIRLSEPHKVANFILEHNKGWSDEKTTTYLEKSKTIEIRAEQTLPVYILYQTVWLDDSGDVVYGDDLYGNDLKLVKELKRNGQLDIPINLM